MKNLYIYILSALLLLVIACSSPEKPATREVKTMEGFSIQDTYQNIQKGETIASIYAITTALTDLEQMESYATELSQSDEKYLIVYFLAENDSTVGLKLNGVLLDPKYREHCKAVYEKTPGVVNFTALPFHS